MSSESADRPNQQPPTTWKELAPWEGKAKPADKVLIGFLLGVPAFYLIMWPLRPFMIAQAPVLLEFVVGAKTAVAAAGAYARVGEVPLWLAVFAGVVGMSKFDWLFWLAGRRWGPRVLELFTSGERQRKWTARLRAMPSWLLAALVFIGRFPGIPGTIVWLVAGLSRMRFWLFITMNVLGSLVVTGAMVALGYALGETAVVVIETIDRYALWVSLGLIVLVAVWQTWRSARKAPAEEAAAAAAADPDSDAEPEQQ